MVGLSLYKVPFAGLSICAPWFLFGGWILTCSHVWVTVIGSSTQGCHCFPAVGVSSWLGSPLYPRHSPPGQDASPVCRGSYMVQCKTWDSDLQAVTVAPEVCSWGLWTRLTAAAIYTPLPKGLSWYSSGDPRVLATSLLSFSFLFATAPTGRLLQPGGQVC